MAYKIEMSDGIGENSYVPSIFLTKRDGDIEYSVMSIGKSDRNDHISLSEGYIVRIWYRKSCHHLTTLELNMALSVKRYNKLVAGDKQQIEDKLINFYLETLKLLKNVGKSFPE